MAGVIMTNGEPDMRRSFHEQLEDLKADVIRLGGMTVELISGATLALLDSDLTVAQQTIHNDEPIDELTHATSGVETGRARVEEGFRAYFDFVENDPAAFRLLFGASARNDAEFADVVDGVLTDAAAAVGTLIEIHGSPEHRLVLAHAIVGMAEGISRHALTDPAGPHDPEQLAHARVPRFREVCGR